LETEKVDVLDLIINTLREHEKTLDELVNRMENIINQEKREQKDREIIINIY